jgi:hypothetical protein
VDIHTHFSPQVAPGALAGALDGLDEPARIDAVAHLRRRELAALYEAAAGNPPLHLVDFVPASVGPRTEVTHEGKNSLPLFTRFQKRFCRPPSGNSTELWGYNEQPNRLFTGPGYFVAHHNDRGELVIDYRFLPDARPEDLPPGWPAIIPNSARLSRFIYNGTVDVMRRVSERVTIGRAERNGKPMDAWFALVRCTPREV